MAFYSGSVSGYGDTVRDVGSLFPSQGDTLYCLLSPRVMPVVILMIIQAHRGNIVFIRPLGAKI